ncbi:hypothetical protein DFP72DRAFT_849687 [Ephemerocybe angulata]|uniref:Uncharacterized protein n=1 Tax=Ephemerocybe angulata TaxID=980116 RepID=A0A8H6HST4_9AGAR|nr:hypothetical protein DFP72DRAFT_849687 [Tulosesus angulatus]
MCRGLRLRQALLRFFATAPHDSLVPIHSLGFARRRLDKTSLAAIVLPHDSNLDPARPFSANTNPARFPDEPRPTTTNTTDSSRFPDLGIDGGSLKQPKTAGEVIHSSRSSHLTRFPDAGISNFGISSSPRPFQPINPIPGCSKITLPTSRLGDERRLRDHCGCFLKQAKAQSRRTSIEVSTLFPGPLKIDFSPLSSNLRRDARIGPEAHAILDR